MKYHSSNVAPDLMAILARCEGAYSDITLRGYKNDLEVFKSWCMPRQESWLPATPEGVARFVDEEAPSKSIATLKRRISAIQFAHRMADLPSPIGHSEVHLAVRRAARAKRRRPKQAFGLSSGLLRRIVGACPNTLAGLRDAALFSVGYDTLCRSSELVAMRVEHLSDDLSSIEVPRSKSDPFGNGRIAYLSPETTARVGAWLEAAELQSGPLFRGLHTRRVSSVALDTSSVRRRIKVAARRARLGGEVVSGLSGHSMRVGAAQDMMLTGFDTLGIMQAGGWRTHSVLARYVENASAIRMHARRWESVSGR
jgi:integrase/recombinase XerD